MILPTDHILLLASLCISTKPFDSWGWSRLLHSLSGGVMKFHACVFVAESSKEWLLASWSLNLNNNIFGFTILWKRNKKQKIKIQKYKQTKNKSKICQKLDQNIEINMENLLKFLWGKCHYSINHQRSSQRQCAFAIFVNCAPHMVIRKGMFPTLITHSVKV